MSKISFNLLKGDPLSPLIFVFIVEVLIQLFLKAQALQEINGFTACSKSQNIPILQYTDDDGGCIP